MDTQCPECDFEGASYQGLSTHYGVQHGGNTLVAKLGKEKLEELYSEYGSARISERLGVDRNTVLAALEAAEIPIRTHSESWELRRKRGDYTEPPEEYQNPEPGLPYVTFNEGYGFIGHRDYCIPVHRLAAIAWYGFDAVDGNHVHHKNGVRWDNREENLEPLSMTEHRRHHAQEMWDKGYGLGAQD